MLLSLLTRLIGGILDRVLSSLGLLGWFRHAYFEYHAHVRLRFKLASGLGEPWTRDGGIPQGCPLSMMFIVALYLPWCRYLSAQVGVEPQLYADNLKCTSRDPELLLYAVRFTTGYVRLVGQEPAPSKCVLLSTSRAVRDEMRNWFLSQEGDKWSVKFDVRDLGGHLDTTFSGLVFYICCSGSSCSCKVACYLCFASSFSWTDGCSSEFVYSWCFAWD